MATAKQRAWRAKFARLYGGGKKKARKAGRRSKGGNMAKKKGGKRRGSFGGIKSLLMPLAIGAVAGAFSDKIPGLNSLPPVVSGAAGGYIAKRNFTGAAVGAAGAYFLGAPLKQMIGGSTGTQNSAW